MVNALATDPAVVTTAVSRAGSITWDSFGRSGARLGFL
jgi:hypothetical protein